MTLLNYLFSSITGKRKPRESILLDLKYLKLGKKPLLCTYCKCKQGENEKQWIMQSTWKALLKAYVYTNLWFSEVSWRLPLQSKNDFWPNLKHYFQVRTAVKTNTKEFQLFQLYCFSLLQQICGLADYALHNVWISTFVSKFILCFTSETSFSNSFVLPLSKNNTCFFLSYLHR